MALVMPLSLGEGDANERMMLARVSPQAFIDRTVDARTRASDNIEMIDGTVMFYHLGPALGKRGLYQEEQLARFANRHWQVRLGPSAAQVASKTALDRWILIGGMLASCLITLGFYQILRDRAKDMTSKLPAGTPIHRLFQSLRKHAETEIKDQVARDEELDD